MSREWPEKHLKEQNLNAATEQSQG